MDHGLSEEEEKHQKGGVSSALEEIVPRVRMAGMRSCSLSKFSKIIQKVLFATMLSLARVPASWQNRDGAGEHRLGFGRGCVDLSDATRSARLKAKYAMYPQHLDMLNCRF